MQKIRIIAIAIATFAFIACGSSNVRFPDKTTKIDLKGKSVLVVAEDNASGDMVASKAFTAAAAQKVGTLKVLPAVPGPAQGISKVYAEFGTKNQGSVNPSDPKAIALDAVLKAAAALGNFDTIVFISAEKAGGMAIPKTIKLELYGAVYDIPGKKVIAAVSDAATVVDTGVAAQMPLKARGIVDDLLTGEEPKKEEAK